jgi:hypothetical protein
MDAATRAAEEAKTAVQAIDAKLDEWEKGREPVLRHHNKHLEAFSLSKRGDNYLLVFCFNTLPVFDVDYDGHFGNNLFYTVNVDDDTPELHEKIKEMISCDYSGTDLAEAMKKVFNRWG